MRQEANLALHTNRSSNAAAAANLLLLLLFIRQINV
jgi:hypothetical protein